MTLFHNLDNEPQNKKDETRNLVLRNIILNEEETFKDFNNKYSTLAGTIKSMDATSAELNTIVSNLSQAADIIQQLTYNTLMAKNKANEANEAISSYSIKPIPESTNECSTCFKNFDCGQDYLSCSGSCDSCQGCVQCQAKYQGCAECQSCDSCQGCDSSCNQCNNCESCYTNCDRGDNCTGCNTCNGGDGCLGCYTGCQKVYGYCGKCDAGGCGGCNAPINAWALGSCSTGVYNCMFCQVSDNVCASWVNPCAAASNAVMGACQACFMMFQCTEEQCGSGQSTSPLCPLSNSCNVAYFADTMWIHCPRNVTAGGHTCGGACYGACFTCNITCNTCQSCVSGCELCFSGCQSCNTCQACHSQCQSCNYCEAGCNTCQSCNTCQADNNCPHCDTCQTCVQCQGCNSVCYEGCYFQDGD